MRLLYAVILIAGFGLSPWWYAVAAVCWAVAFFIERRVAKPQLDEQEDIFNRSTPIYRPPQIVTPRMLEAGLPVLAKHRDSAPEEMLRAVYEAMFAKHSW